MPEIFLFQIPEAYAQPIQNGIYVTLVYPEESKRYYIRKRLYGDAAAIGFGIEALTHLALSGGTKIRIGTPEYPLRPSSGAIIDLLRDGSFFTHRRDGGTDVHPWHHGIPSGFPSSLDHFLDLRTLQRTEGAEESILFTMDNIPWVYVPKDPVGRDTTLKRLQELEITNKTIETDVDYLEGEDVLEVKNEKGGVLARCHVNIYLSWEETINVTSAQTRYWPKIDPANVRAIDAESFTDKTGKLNHLNREMFHLSRKEIEGKKFGDLLEYPRVYKLERRGEYGVPVLQENPQVPYHFRPDDGLRRMLDYFRIEGWKDLWISHEIDRAKEKLESLKNKKAGDGTRTHE